MSFIIVQELQHTEGADPEMGDVPFQFEWSDDENETTAATSGGTKNVGRDANYFDDDVKEPLIQSQQMQVLPDKPKEKLTKMGTKDPTK